MTVAELIVILQRMPQDAKCIRTICSDYDEMDEEDLGLIKAEDKKIVLSAVKDWRNDPQLRYHHYRSTEWPEGSQPNFVTVCHFDGN